MQNKESGRIGIEQLSFSYPDGRSALKNLSLQIQTGERVALVGPNGAGKSTLLLHFNGIYPSQKGSVQVGGWKVESRQISRVRGIVGLVFQDPNDQLFCPTVFEDVAFGPLYQGLSQEEVRIRVTEALIAVGMEKTESRSSHQLSVGEKKRVALATVLAMRPQILVLDEPTAGLDPRGRRELGTLLQTLPQTLIVASHDLDWIADLLPRWIVMNDGQIVADLPGHQLLMDSLLLEKYGLA